MIFIWLTTLFLGLWLFKKIQQWKELPPGPWGLPILGYLPFINRTHPHLTLTSLSKQYGPIYGINMGNVYTVVLSDHKIIREAFAKDTFTGRAPLYLTHGIMKGNGIICAEGALWKDQRKQITLWLKSYGMGKNSVSRDKLEERITTGANELLNEINKSHGVPVDLNHLIADSLGNVVNDLIFGFKFPPGDKTWQWFKNIQEEGVHEMGVAGVVNFLPFIRFILPSVRNTMEVLIRGQDQTHRLYASIIARRRKMLNLDVPKGAERLTHSEIFNNHPEGFIKCIKYSKNMFDEDAHYFDPSVLISSKEECILDSFLKEQKRRYDNREDNAHFMKDEQMHYLLADMFGAGLDTTATTFSWFLLFIALYQDEQDILRKHILSVYPEECQIDSSKLPYVMATVYETQRIRSIVPVGIPHGCLQDTYLGNYRVPKGTMVVPLQWAIHMDSKLWKDPENFRPSRFLDDNGNLLKPQEFIPFQTGKRMCPGDELSRMLSAGLIVRLLRSFRIHLASEPPTDEELLGSVGVTLSAPAALFICESL